MYPISDWNWKNHRVCIFILPKEPSRLEGKWSTYETTNQGMADVSMSGNLDRSPRP